MTVDSGKGVDVERLKAWMMLNNIDPAGLGKIVGIGRTATANLLAGKVRLHPDKARKLIDASGGQLTWADLFPFTRYQPKNGAA